ncbi:MAG TPA: hypothetical protein VIJ14_07940 [Rhabdochlamydiaceae bacterium]
MSNDNPADGFLGLCLLGAAFFIGNKTGKNKAYREVADAQRDREIDDLKRQLADLMEQN